MSAGRLYAYDDGDFQVWHTESQEIKINDESKLVLEEEFYFGDDAEDFYYQHYDIGCARGVTKNFEAGINYRQVYEKKRGDFKQENRPHINADLKWEWREFKLDDRSRLEYRHFNYQTDNWRYCNKFNVKFPWKFTKLEIQPYAADEIHVDLNDAALNRNRLYSGVGFNLTEKLKGEIYYLFQSSKSSGKWSDINVLGTKMKVSF